MITIYLSQYTNSAGCDAEGDDWHRRSINGNERCQACGRFIIHDEVNTGWHLDTSCVELWCERCVTTVKFDEWSQVRTAWIVQSRGYVQEVQVRPWLFPDSGSEYDPLGGGLYLSGTSDLLFSKDAAVEEGMKRVNRWLGDISRERDRALALRDELAHGQVEKVSA